METVTSRIKTMFKPDLLRLIAAICDNRRIESNNEKMVVLCDLLYTEGINFEILGGATNRIALQIEGYAVKFAMDEQGYLDNEIEYALSPELQPFVTKSYETNGYIQVQELVEVMTKELFQVHRQGIYKVLNTLCQDYLLGDVGYLEKNRTNWGIRGGQPVILDYAYCHRATENLFTCSRCGAPLTYDSAYDKLMCTDRSGCKTIYTYNERKRVQGKKVDEDMIKERKAESICLSGTDVSKKIEMFEDRLVGDNYFIIDCPGDLHEYERLKEEAEMKVSINGGYDEDDQNIMMQRFEAMVDLARNPDDARARAILETSSSEQLQIPEPIYTDRYQDEFMYNDGVGIRNYHLRHYHYGPVDDYYDEDDEENEESDDDYNAEDALSAMIDKINAEKRKAEEEHQRCEDEQLQDYLDKRNGRPDEVVDSEITDDSPIVINTGIAIGSTKDDDTKEPSEKQLPDAEATEPLVIESPSPTTSPNDEESKLKELHESLYTEPPIIVTSSEPSEKPEAQEPLNPEDAAVLINGKPLPIGEEVVL